MLALLLLSSLFLASVRSDEDRLFIAGKTSVVSVSMTGHLLDQAPAEFQWWQHSQLIANPGNGTVCWVMAKEDQDVDAFLRCALADRLQDSWDLPKPNNFRLNNVEAIAVDWDSGNWYITARRENYVCTDEFYQCAFLAKSEGNVRFFTAYDMANRLVFIVNNIYEVNGESYSAEVMHLDGTHRRVIADDLEYPIDMTVDPKEKRIYWIDQQEVRSKFIYSMNYEGQDKKLVGELQEEWGTPAWRRVVEVFDDKLFAIWKDRGMMGIFSKTGEELDLLVEDHLLLSTRNSTNPLDLGVMSALQVYSNSTQPDTGNPCGLNNGGCEHFCIPSAKHSEVEFTCVCPDGKELIDTVCRKPQYAFLIIAAGDSIQAVHLEMQQSDVILNGSTNVTKVDYILESELNFTLYWIDAGDIFMGNWIPGRVITNTKRIFKASQGTEVVELAVEWTEKLLIWIDVDTTGPSYEKMARLNMANMNASQIHMFKEMSHRNPKALFLQLGGRYLGFSQASWGTAELKEMDLSGDSIYLFAFTLRKLLKVQPTEIRVVLPANNDGSLRRVFWIDDETRTLHCLYGTLSHDEKYRQVLKDDARLTNPGGLDVFRDRVYWTDRLENILYSADSENGQDVQTLPTLAGRRFYDVKVLHPERQLPSETSFCSEDNGGCSNICFKGAELFQSVKMCACPNGMQLDINTNTTCVALTETASEN